jgi:4-hydroxybenzoate polyprenyltransferase
MNVSAYISLLRPHQWLKNLILLFPPFLAGKLHTIPSWDALVLPVASFSLISSMTYIVNDIADCANDSHHPLKRLRPLPAGLITRRSAICLAILCGGGGFTLAVLSTPAIVPWLLAYLLGSLFYTFVAKHIFLLDLAMIALLFLVRLQAGGAAYSIHITMWLYMAVLLLALFLSAGKRLSEFNALGSTAALHRSSMEQYHPAGLMYILYASGVCVLCVYALYCISHPYLLLTLPVCAYGLWRYIHRVRSGRNGDPTISLLHDRHLLVVGCCWVVFIALAQYPDW